MNYQQAASGDTVPVATIAGYPIVNSLSSIQPPLLPMLGTATSTGGFIVAGTLIYGVTAVDSSGNESAVSFFCHVTTAPGVTHGTNSIPIRMYDPGTVSFNLYGGTSELRMTYQGNTLIAGLVSGSIVLTALRPPAGNQPDLAFDHFHLRGRKVVLPGVWWNFVTFAAVVGSTAKIEINGIVGADSWTGYIVSSLCAGAGVQLNYQITAQVGALLSTSENVSVGANFTGADFVAIRATGKIVSTNTIGDPLFANAGRTLGLGINSQVGNHVLITAGTGVGQERTIVSNTGTTMTINGVWTVLPDATSVWIVVEPNWIYDSPGQSVSTMKSAVADNSIGTLILENIAGLTILIQVLTEDVNGNSLPDFFAPVREVYITGNAGAGSLFSILPPDQLTFNLDTDNDGNVVLSALQVQTNGATVGRITCDLYWTDGTASGPTCEIHAGVAPGDLTITFVAVGGITPAEQTYALLEQEIIFIQSVSGFVATVLRAQFGTTAAAHAGQNTTVSFVNPLWPLDLIVGTGLSITQGMRASNSTPEGNSFVSDYVPSSGLVRLSAPLGTAPATSGPGSTFHAYPLILPIHVTSTMISVPLGFFASADTRNWSPTIPLPCAGVVYAQVKATSSGGTDSPWFTPSSPIVPLNVSPLRTHGGNTFVLTFPQIPFGTTLNAFAPLEAPQTQDFFGSYGQISDIVGAPALPIPVPVAATVLTPLGLTSTGSITLAGTADATSQVTIRVTQKIVGGRPRGMTVSASPWVSDVSLTTLTLMAAALSNWLNNDPVFAAYYSTTAAGAVISVFDLTNNGGTVGVARVTGTTTYTGAGFTSVLGILGGRSYAFVYIDTTDSYVSDLSSPSDLSGPTGSYSSLGLGNIPVCPDSRVNFIDIYGYPDGTQGPVAYKIARIANTSSDGSGFTSYSDTQTEPLTGLTAYPGMTQPSQANNLIVTMYRGGVEWFEVNVPPNSAQSTICSGPAMRGLAQGTLVTSKVVNNIAPLTLKMVIR